VTASSQRLRVLVVDDSRFSRRILRLLLEGAGDFEVIGEAIDGESGLEMARALQPDAITLDMDMPALNGLGMLARLRLESQVPVVIVTALPQGDEQVKAAQSFGGVEIVVKTYSSSSVDLSVFGDELTSKIRSMITRQSQHT
jgi:chemotaxis response regulator CheB